MTASILKKLGLATAVLLLVWVVYVYRQVPHEKAPFAKVLGQPAVSITLSQGPRQAALLKEKSSWFVFDGKDGPRYAVDMNVANNLINGLKGLRLDDVISTRTDRFAEYEVTADSGITANVAGPKGSNSVVTGVFGKQAPDMAHIYFRYSDKPNVYLARGLVRGDLGHIEMNYWRDRHLMDIPEGKIQVIHIEGHGFTTDVVKMSTDSWSVNGKAVDPGLADALVGVLAHAQVDEFIDPSVDPKMTFESLTYAHINIKGTDSSADLRIGAQDPKTKRYPVSMGKAFGLGWMSQSALESLLRKPDSFKPKQ